MTIIWTKDGRRPMRAMDDVDENGTLSQKVARGLADEIVSGRLPSGYKLDEKVIAERFGVSRTPVREALRELAITGLVEIAPRRGATVVQVDLARLRDMFEASAEIEALCARFAAERMTQSERLQLQMTNRKSRDAVTAGDPVAYAELNEQLHDEIFDGARNLSLAELARIFRIRLSPFRVQIFYRKAQRMTSSNEEHDVLVAAISAGEADTAQRAMRAHLTNSSLNVIEFFDKKR